MKPKFTAEQSLNTTLLNVPVQLLHYSIMQKELPSLRVFLLMKMFAAGTIKNNKQVFDDLSYSLGYTCNKSVKNHVDLLIKNKWINYDPKSNSFFVKGFDDLRKLLRIKSRRAVHIQSFDLLSKKRFVAFCTAALISSIIQNRKRKEKVGLLKRSSIGDLNPSKSDSYYKISTETIANEFKCSKGQVHNLKKLSAKFGFIKVKHSYIETEHPAANKNSFLKAYPEFGHLITIIDEKIVLKDIDQIKGNIKFRRRKKIEL